MVGPGTGLEYVAAGFGALLSALVVARQLFGEEGILSTGWNKRQRAIQVLRNRYPEFDSAYRKVDNPHWKGLWEWVSIFTASGAPQGFVALILFFPEVKEPGQLWLAVLGVGFILWFASSWIGVRARRYERSSAPLSDADVSRLGRFRFVEGRLVMTWFNFPLHTLILTIPAIVSQVSSTSPNPSLIESYALAIASAVGMSILIGLSTVRTLSVIGGASYADFRNRTHEVPRVRVSLKEWAGGKSTVTGSLLAIGGECVVQTDDGFVERVDWEHLGRLAVQAPSQAQAAGVSGNADSRPIG